MPYVGHKPLWLKFNFFFHMTRTNVCFNVSFLDFNLCLNCKQDFKSYELAYVPRWYQCSCSQYLIRHNLCIFSMGGVGRCGVGLHTEVLILLSKYNVSSI